MFERFDESAQQPVKVAREEARRLGHPFIDTEHLLLGLLKASKELEDIFWLHHIDPAEAVRKIEEIHPPADGPKPDLGQLPFSPWAGAALMTAAKEGAKGGKITSGHLLLGLALESQGLAGRFLRDAGIHPEELRKRL